MMEVRSSVTAVTVLLALLCAVTTGDEYVPAKLYVEANPVPTYDEEGVATQQNRDDDIQDLLMTVIARLIQNIDPNKLDEADTHRLLAAITGLSPRQQSHLGKSLLDVNLDLANTDIIIPEDDKRSRCRGRGCRNVGGLNPNANLRPLPFGKRSRFSGANKNQGSSSSSDFSNKRGRTVKNRLRERVPHWTRLPFGRR
ncbi:uncharacterized protein LOC121421316 [Lytechinus variegatus]|uniref:uncharacterized protein LOC121421316 n=1 Tax=Lytechinus variegatus TaxID=7654 RepID=UPI001BB10505|nr:uncharacterized protein LOC121421316 [Lytechinus variegatus]XP_041471933.1 uncharacterized protein LOC121421316 [Lytechinus variegatus]